jgi:hypothetical protein
VHAVAVTRFVTALAVCGAPAGAKVAGERIYESSYRNACVSGPGLACDTPPPSR